MGLREFKDETIEIEMGDQLGEYLGSFMYGDREVEIHVFRESGGDLVAFVTTSPGQPLGLAELVAQSALEIATARWGTIRRSRLVWDPHSLPRSGSL